MAERPKPPRIERIEPGEYKSLIDGILDLNRQTAGRFAITCGAEAVFFRHSPQSHDKKTRKLYGVHEHIGMVVAEVDSTPALKRALRQSATIGEYSVSEVYSHLEHITPQDTLLHNKWLKTLQKSKADAISQFSIIKRREFRRPTGNLEVKRQIRNTLREL